MCPSPDRPEAAETDGPRAVATDRPEAAVDWLALCRRATTGVQRALARHPDPAQRALTSGRGEGGDLALVIDRAAEDAVFAELEALGVGLTAVSEERGQVPVAGGGPGWVVIDPIDGSLNAKRGMPHYALSVAVAEGPTMADVTFGYVFDLGSGEEWWAARGEGAHLDGARLPQLDRGAGLEVLGLEMAYPRRVAAAAPFLAESGARRVRVVGAIALSLCWVAAGRFDAALSLGPSRSVDAAAAQLVVREVGLDVAFIDVDSDLATVSLDLAMRSRVLAAAPRVREDLLALITADGAPPPPWPD
jgi:myo-inositol-1(or 4)-monophosphatase